MTSIESNLNNSKLEYETTIVSGRTSHSHSYLWLVRCHQLVWYSYYLRWDWHPINARLAYQVPTWTLAVLQRRFSENLCEGSCNRSIAGQEPLYQSSTIHLDPASSSLPQTYWLDPLHSPPKILEESSLQQLLTLVTCSRSWDGQNSLNLFYLSIAL